MKNNISQGRSFLLVSTLSMLSVLALSLFALVVYIGIYYTETRVGLTAYIADLFEQVPFLVIYLFLLAFSLVFLASIVLMWLARRVGLVMYVVLSVILIVLFLFSNPVDWFNIVLLTVILLILFLERKSFGKALKIQE